MNIKSALIIFLGCISLLFVNPVAGQEVSVLQKFSKSRIQGGEKVIVEVTVKKGSVAGIGKIQQILPKGMVAAAVEVFGATFTQEDRTLKIIWLSLPQTPEFKITYELSTDAVEGGSMSIGGRFSYMVQGEKLNADIPSERLLVETATTRTDIITISGEGDDKGSRTLVMTGDGTIKSDTRALEETKPEEDAKPQEAEREEKAKAIEDTREAEQEATRKQEEEAEKEKQAREEEARIKAQAEREQIKKSGEAARRRLEEEAARQKAELEMATKRKTEEEAPAETVEKTEPVKAEIPAVTSHNIIYRIQVGASQTKLPPSTFTDKYKLDEEIFVDFINGWYKYSVGSYTKPSQAFFKRKILVDKNGVKGAFVIAFDNGKSLPVNKAREITGE